MKIYKISNGWKIFGLLGALIFIGLSLFLIISATFVDNDFENPLGSIITAYVISFSLLFFSITAIYEVIKGRFIIDDDRIYTTGLLFNNRELLLTEIKGFRVNEHYIFIEPISRDKKRIKISRYFENHHQILSWLGTYPNLDEVEVKKEHQDFLDNSVFGATPSERISNLEKGEQIATVLNWAGGIVGIWAFFWAEPYNYAILACIIVPILAVIALKISNGILRFDKKEEGTHPSIMSAILFPSCAIGIRALMDFEIYDYSTVWLPLFCILLVLTGIIYINSEEFQKTKGYLVLLGIVMVLGFYSYGALITSNCIYDNSKPTLFQASAVSKHISSGKTTTYYVKVTPWGNRGEANEISVSENFYEQVETGDNLTIYVKKGWFNIPWIIIKK